MSDKAEKKKQYILDKARAVFSEKGFKDVTMKDIVEACDISRGGLYIYFDSTEQIMEELLKAEAEEKNDIFSKTAKKDSTAGDVLALFLLEQKKELLSKKDNMTVALYEYLFSNHVKQKEDTVMKPKFNFAVAIMTHLIENGVETGDFYCEDPEAAARNIMYAIEGLKIASCTFGITESDVDKELVYIINGLIAGDE